MLMIVKLFYCVQSGLSARERRRLKQRQKGDKNALPTPPTVPVLPSPNEVIAAKVKRSYEGLIGGKVIQTANWARVE